MLNREAGVGTTAYKYDLATAATGGTVLATKATTGGLLTQVNSDFTFTARVPSNVTTLYIRGTRLSGIGTAAVTVSGRIHLQAEIQATKVDVDASGFNGNLSTTDVNAQLVAQKVDDLEDLRDTPDQVIARTQYNGSGGNPAPDITYTINSDLQTANGRELYHLYAVFTIEVHNAQVSPFGSSSYRWELEEGGNNVVRQTFGTNTLTSGSNQTLTQPPLRINTGVSSLTLTGVRVTGAGTARIHVSGRIYLVPQVDASIVDVAASGFNGNLATTDDTVQKVAQKLDDLTLRSNAAQIAVAASGFDGNLDSGDSNVQAALQALDNLTLTPVTEIRWLPLFTSFQPANGATAVLTNQEAFRVGNLVFLSGTLTFRKTSAGVSAFGVDMSLPWNAVGTPVGGGNLHNKRPQTVVRCTIAINKLRVFIEWEDNPQNTPVVNFHIWYLTNQ